MFEKCHCMYCQGAIEFDLSEFVQSGEGATERLGQKVECPHCQQATVLAVKKKRVRFPAQREFVHPADVPLKTHWLTLIIGSVGIVGLILLLGWCIHENPQVLGIIGQGGVSLAMAVIGSIIGILLLVLTIFWIIFPWMVYVLLRRIETNTRPRPLIPDEPAAKEVPTS